MLTREPLVIRGAIVAAVTALIHVLIVLGALPIDADAEHAIAGAVDLIGTAVLVVWTRGKVTPVADPVIPAADGPKPGPGVVVD
ncbi:membrane protein [Arthrobacter phage Cassia]|uniref:Membrane protein n=1 Tax=Arthrobacter phage Cassia TaxID=2927275 RepID=A0AAF0GLL8_9CAUD|nr:membrane protein [Arthrobacter phage Cassia]